MDGKNSGNHSGISKKAIIFALLVAALAILAALAALQGQMLRWILFLAAALLLAAAGAAELRLLRALERDTEKIRNGERLDVTHGPAELRALASAYNELLTRRDSAVTVLHRETLTDALTGLPNRLAFEKYIAQLGRENPHAPVTVFSLDVNGLKETNDRKGHTFGDALLRDCAACISDVFADGEGRQCFRFGGDEFSAFWVDVPSEEIEPTLERFAQEQKARGVSISVGLAHTGDFSGTTVTELYEEADRNMYDDKTEFHRKQAQEVLDWLKLTT